MGRARGSDVFFAYPRAVASVSGGTRFRLAFLTGCGVCLWKNPINTRCHKKSKDTQFLKASYSFLGTHRKAT